MIFNFFGFSFTVQAGDMSEQRVVVESVYCPYCGREPHDGSCGVIDSGEEVQYV